MIFFIIINILISHSPKCFQIFLFAPVLFLTYVENKIRYWDPLESGDCPQEFARSRGTGARLVYQSTPSWMADPTGRTGGRSLA